MSATSNATALTRAEHLAVLAAITSEECGLRHAIHKAEAAEDVAVANGLRRSLADLQAALGKVARMSDTFSVQGLDRGDVRNLACLVRQKVDSLDDVSCEFASVGFGEGADALSALSKRWGVIMEALDRAAA
ncbi:hypothetical protein [Pseudoduganella namucuonensis]|uniref:Uncharacterized protein n=1 Tax=Pseudoduganella namucuonensis TaxID=1035707 RepID=A0A1I7KQ44_9BURK|nr:hypothetical protein [Pseudoduganella namucuonensis]SFU99531.1 hypothetical protein SAMN05216552_1018122 [Pseudoduganella namucuonensis]